jgi:hypothetical protein
MEDIDDTAEPHRINCPVGIPVVIIHDFQYAGATETLERLDPDRLPAELRVP